MNGRAADCVGFEAVKLALRWCDFLEQHARKIYADELSPELAAARALYDKNRAGTIEDGDHVWDIYRRQWSGRTNLETVADGLSVLGRHNIIKIERRKTAVRTAEIIRIHPEI